MKKILTVFAFAISINAHSQNGIYIITEKYNGMVANVPSFDSLFVTNPSGTTTSYSLPHYIINPAAHDSQLAVILNNISSQGFRIIPHTERMGVSNTTITPSYFELRTFFMGMPWTTAGLIPAGVNNSLIKITNVFPNPASNVVNLKFASSSNNSKLYLIHSGGYIINEFDVSNLTDFSVNTSLLSNGTYLFFLVSNGIYSESKSLIKQ